jgi:MFS family permease
LILAVLGLAQLMVILDATVMNIALPTAQRALAFSDADRQWIVTGYALAFGSLLLLGGRLSDFLGRKFALIVGLGGFALASAIGGFSIGFSMLLGARIFQGVFGALLAPAALSLLTTTFTDREERGKAFGIYGAISGAGGATGLLLGGVLTSYASWRWNLLVNVPIGVVTITGAAVLLHHSRAATRAPLDVPGVATVTSGLFALVYGLSHAETTSWTNTATLSFLAAAVILLVSFGIIETRVKHPLLPMRVVLNRHRGGSFLSMFFCGAGMFAFFFFLTFYLQGTLGYTPVRTGIAFLANVAALVIAAQFSTNLLLHRFGPRPVVVSGRHGDPAGSCGVGRGFWPHHAGGNKHSHARCRNEGCRRSLGHGVNHAAGRRLDRNGAAQHPGGKSGYEFRGRSSGYEQPPDACRHPRLRHRLLLCGSCLRRRRRGGMVAAWSRGARRPRETHGHARV